MRSLLVTAALAAGLSGCVSQAEGDRAGWYAARGAPPPSGERVFVCHGFGCRIVDPVSFSTSEMADIAGPLAKGVASAEAERAAVSRAVQRYETIVGARIGTSADRGNIEIGGADDSQMDCLDESTNTTSLLILLEEHGLLHHHTVRRPVARGFVLDGRYPHATAVLAESEGGVLWAVDSWPDDNGKPPLIMPLDAWMRLRRPPSGVGAG